MLGTNPLAFAWPSSGKPPYGFNFAITAASRADVALHRQGWKAILEGVYHKGYSTTDLAEVLTGAMLPFGGHTGSAPATMVELMARPLIGDRISRLSAAFDQSHNAVVFHGELISASDPAPPSGLMTLPPPKACWTEIEDQGTRLPGSRRHGQRARNLREGISVSKAIYDRVRSLMEE